MRLRDSFNLLCFVLCLSLLAFGCRSKSSNSDSSGESAEAAGTDSAVVTDTASDSSGESDDLPESLIEPFDPPPLADLESKYQWQSMPVLDAIEHLAEQKKNEPALVSVAEALDLKNDSLEANEKILSALSHLPPNDEAVKQDATILRHSPMKLKSTNPLMISSVSEMDVVLLVNMSLIWYDPPIRSIRRCSLFEELEIEFRSAGRYL